LQPSVFKVFQLQKFSSEDVAYYARSWFAIDERLDPQEKEAIAEAFLEESLSVPDLRSNALMLGLLCNVYRGARTIPQNRAELYEQCAIMLFERWDAGRGIAKPGLLKADARAALQDVALWIYTTDQLANGVTERDLRRRLTGYWSKRYENKIDAEDAAQQLLALWQGRSWILTDVGSSANRKDRIFKFTHQTFLEYFCSVELVRIRPSPDLLWTELEPKVAVGGWDIVAQLAIQRLNDSYADAGNSVVTALISSARSKGQPARLNLLLFASRNLGNLYVTPDTCRDLTRCAVGLCLELPSIAPMSETWASYSSTQVVRADEDCDGGEVDDRLLDEVRTFDFDDLSRPLKNLAALEFELGRVARSEIGDYCLELALSNDDGLAAKGFLLGAGMGALLGASRRGDADAWVQQLIESRDEDLLRRSIRSWSVHDFWVPIISCRLGLLPVNDAVRLAGPHALMCALDQLESGTWTTFVEIVLRSYLGLKSAHEDELKVAPEDARETLILLAEQLGNRVPRFDSNWVGRTNLCDDIIVPSYGPGGRKVKADKTQYVEKDPRVAYSAAVLVAVFVELEEWAVADYSEDQAASLKLGPITEVAPIFIFRRLDGFRDEADGALARVMMSNSHKDVLRRWANRDINFTGPLA